MMPLFRTRCLTRLRSFPYLPLSFKREGDCSLRLHLWLHVVVTEVEGDCPSPRHCHHLFHTTLYICPDGTLCHFIHCPDGTLCRFSGWGTSTFHQVHSHTLSGVVRLTSCTSCMSNIHSVVLINCY
jgi:hypothetical protein